MKNTLFYALFLCAISSLHAQQPFAKMVVGLEGSMDLQQFSDGIKAHPMPTLQVEYPFHKFGYQTFDGGIGSMQIGENNATIFHYADKVLKPVYWSIPLRIQYRLPCNCVYLHGAASLDFFDTGVPEKVSSDYWTTSPPTRTWSRRQFFRSSLRTYELGIGFKLHSSDYFRLVARPSFVWTENPEIRSGAPAYVSSLRMTFGAQYAFVRYGGKK